MAEDREVTEVGAATTPPMWGSQSRRCGSQTASFAAFGAKRTTRFPLVQDEPLDEHETHERLAETNAIAQEATAMLARDLHQRPVRLFLIAVELREHLRAGFFPLAGRHLMAAKELVQRLRVDIKRE